MSSIFYTGCMVLLWIVNLFNGTGLGMAYKTTELAQLVMIVIALCCVAYRAMQDGDIVIPRKYFFVLIPLVAVIVGTSLANNQRLQGLGGFWVYLVVYIMSFTRPDIKALRLTAVAYGILGILVLFVFNYTSILSGWNANSIAMLGLYSFLVFTIPFFGMRGWRSYVLMPLMGTAYVLLIVPTNSRSCIIIIVVALILVLRLIPVKKVIQSSRGIFLVLLVPLVVSISICLLSLFADISNLKQWSLETFEKDLFNGRDELWLTAFRIIKDNVLFGDGNIKSTRWHNSAMTVLTAFGVVGYTLWIRLFHLILKGGRHFTDDTTVNGAITVFLVLYCHQSVELGFISSSPMLIPYIVLGILLGRVNYLKHRERLHAL